MLHILKNKIRFTQTPALLMLLVSLIILPWSSVAAASTVTYVLHEGNGFTVDIAPEVSISRSGESGPISITGAIWQAEFALPGEQPAISQFTSIGGTGNSGPVFFVQSNQLFDTIVSNDTNNDNDIFTTQLIYWNQSGNFDFFAPGFESLDLSGFTNPVAALTITSVPIPAGIGLFGSALLSLLVFRQRKVR